MATDIIAQALALKGIKRDALNVRLRSVANGAKLYNPTTLNPLMDVAAWASTTAYTTGTVVKNGGNWYVCATAGTSAGSGGPTHITGQAVVDGSVYWTWIGGAPISANEPGAPSVSSSTTAPTSPNNISIYPVGQSALYKYYGGAGEVVSTNYHYPYVGDNKVATRQYGNGVRIGFDCDSSIITFSVPAGSPAPRIMVDGRYISYSCLARVATLTYYTFTFSGRRKWRKFIVTGPKDKWSWYGVIISLSAQVRPTSTDNDVKAFFIGDSLFAGSSYGPWLSGDNVPWLIGDMLGWNDVWNLSKGGTGYINTGGGYYTYGERVPQLIAAKPDIAVFGCPTNDTGSSAAAVTAAVKQCLLDTRAGYAGPIVVLGAWPRNDANVATTEAAVLAGVTQAADPRKNTFFIPLYGAASYPIITGSWNTGANTVNALLDNSAMMIGGDGTHPTEYGANALAYYVAGQIASNVVPFA